jgi:hypothetical protein
MSLQSLYDNAPGWGIWSLIEPDRLQWPPTAQRGFDIDSLLKIFILQLASFLSTLQHNVELISSVPSKDANLTNRWIQTGGNSNVSIRVPDLCHPGERGQTLEQTADTLQSMNVWGDAQSFRKVILGIRRR